MQRNILGAVVARVAIGVVVTAGGALVAGARR